MINLMKTMERKKSISGVSWQRAHTNFIGIRRVFGFRNLKEPIEVEITKVVPIGSCSLLKSTTLEGKVGPREDRFFVSKSPGFVDGLLGNHGHDL